MTNQTYPAIKMVISGGGTGGHLFPAIAIAQKVHELSPSSQILFVGAKGKIEMEKVPQYGFQIKGLWISGFNRSSLAKNVNLPFKIMSSLWQAFQIIRKFKPQIAVGVGGYASGPLLFAAGKKGIPTLLQEQNSFPGVTNKMLATKASKICVAFPGMDKYFEKTKLVETGNPIRLNVINMPKLEAAKVFNLSIYKPTILVIGGSLGAATLNDAMEYNLDKLIKSGVQIIWQCGNIYEENLLQRTKDKLTENIIITSFIANMAAAYSMADLVISRAGALSISEITFLGKASILVPSPNVAEDHQTKNAQVLVNYGASRLITDRNAVNILVDTALELLANAEEIRLMEEKALQLAKPNAATNIANQIFSLLK